MQGTKHSLLPDHSKVSLLAYQPLLGAFPHGMGVIHVFLSPGRQGYNSSLLQAGVEEQGEEGPGSSALV